MDSSDGSASGGPGDGGFGRARTYRLLGDPRRIALVESLRERGWTAELSELARAVADREVDASPDDVRTALHHAHLPLLDRSGVVVFDHETGHVTPGERARLFEQLLDETAVLATSAHA